jgi:VanZ family protein
MLALTSWPSPPPVPVVSDIPSFDKLIHLTLYAVEAWWLYRSVKWPGGARFSAVRALAIVGAMAVWGVADEAHQTWIPRRSMQGEDVLADVAGAAVGSVLASWASRGGRRSATGADPSLRRPEQIPRCARDESARGIARRVTS